MGDGCIYCGVEHMPQAGFICPKFRNMKDTKICTNCAGKIQHRMVATVTYFTGEKLVIEVTDLRDSRKFVRGKKPFKFPFYLRKHESFDQPDGEELIFCSTKCTTEFLEL